MVTKPVGFDRPLTPPEGLLVRRSRDDRQVSLQPPPQQHASIWGTEYRKATLGLFALAFLVAYSTSAITTAMPRAAQELDGLALYGLAFAVTMATSVVAMASAALWIDKAGPGIPLMAGIGIDCAGLLTAAAAPTMDVLVAGRAVQGLGIGLEGVALYVVIARVFPAALRPRMFGVLAAAWVLPSIVGPAVSGAVTDSFGWRWVFVSVPVLAVGAVALVRAGTRGKDLGGADSEFPGPQSPDSEFPGPQSPDPENTGPESMDRGGAGNGSAGDGGIFDGGAGDDGTFAGTGDRFRSAAWRRPAWALAAAGAALLLGDASARARPWWAGELAAAVVVLVLAVPRLLPRGTWRSRRGLPSLILMRALIGTAFTLGDVYLPLLMITERGLPAWLAGLSLTVGGVTWFTGSWLAGRDVASPRLRLLLGAAGILGGIAVCTLVVVPAVPLEAAWLGWAFAGLGMGMAYPTQSVLVLEASPVADQGVHASALQLGETLTTATALGVVGAVYASLLEWAPAGYVVAFTAAGALAAAAMVVARRTTGSTAQATAAAG